MEQEYDNLWQGKGDISILTAVLKSHWENVKQMLGPASKCPLRAGCLSDCNTEICLHLRSLTQ